MKSILIALLLCGCISSYAQPISTATVEADKTIPKTQRQIIDEILNNEWIPLNDSSIAGIAYISKESMKEILENGEIIRKFWLKSTNNQYRKNDPALNNATTLMLLVVDCKNNWMANTQTYVISQDSSLPIQSFAGFGGFKKVAPNTVGESWLKSACLIFNTKK